MTTATPGREWVAVFSGQDGAMKIVYLSAVALAEGLAAYTAEGYTVTQVVQRDRKAYSKEKYPELYN